MADTTLYLSVRDVYPRLRSDLNVALQPTIQIQFNQPVNAALVETDVALNQYVILVRVDTDEAVAVTFSEWDQANRILKFTPAESLAAGETYQITLRKELKTAAGRGMITDYTWVFQTSAAALGQVALNAPGDSTSHTGAPTLAWTGVWIPSGVVFYDVQLDDSWQFPGTLSFTTTTTVSGSGGTHSVDIGVSLADRTAYYWRVRARTGAATGDWSETRSFYLGSATQAAPDARLAYEPDLLFRLTELLPPDGSPHLGAYPTIQATFSQPLVTASITDSSFQLWRDEVDGTASTQSVQITGSTFTVAGNVAQLVPGEEIAVNRRYTIRLTTDIESSSGEVLSETITSYFTSAYRPLYGGVIAVRADLGAVMEPVSDDEILFQLWRASIEVHGLLYTRVYQINETATTQELINYNPTAANAWALQRYAELTATLALLESYYWTVASEAGRRVTLSTFEYEVKVELLEELRKKLAEIQKKRDDLVAKFFNAVVAPRITIKSSYWWPDPCTNPRARDWSWRGRKSF